MSKKNTAQKVSLEKLHIVGLAGPVSVGHEVCGTQGPGSNTLLPGGKACCAKNKNLGWAGLGWAGAGASPKCTGKVALSGVKSPDNSLNSMVPSECLSTTTDNHRCG